MKKLLRFFSFLLCVAILVAGLTCLRVVITDGASMEPTFSPGSYTLVIRSFREARTGDVVLIERDGTYVLKLVAFVAGESVPNGSACYDYWGSTVIPEGYVFVVGDNAQVSHDSRYEDFGLVSQDQIWGYVAFSFGGE